MSFDHDTILRRAAKLAAITSANATEAEALLAADRLATILAENNLSLRDIPLVRLQSEIVEEQSRTAWSRLPWWVSALGSNIAAGTHCRAVLIQSGNNGMKRLGFIGHKTDAAVASWFFNLLEQCLPRLASAYANQRKTTSGGDHVQIRRGFVIGFCRQIEVRLALVTSPAQTDTGMTSLIVIKNRAIGLWIFEHLGTADTRAKSKSVIVDGAALQAGVEQANAQALQMPTSQGHQDFVRT